MAEVASAGTQVADPNGGSAPVAALFCSRNNAPPVEVMHIACVEGALELPAKPVGSNLSNLQHCCLALHDWLASQQPDIDPALILLMLTSSDPGERDHIRSLSDLPSSVPGTRKIFGKQFRATSKGNKAQVGMRLGSDEPLNKVCSDIRNSCKLAQIYPSCQSKPDTCQPVFLAGSCRNMDPIFLATQINFFCAKAPTGELPLEHCVPAPREEPLEIALQWCTTCNGISKEEREKKGKKGKKGNPAYALHVICQRNDHERALTLCTAFFNDESVKSVSALNTCVVPAWGSDTGFTEKGKCQEWLKTQKDVCEQIDFHNAPGATLSCDQLNAKGVSLHQHAMWLTRNRNDDTTLFGNINMTSQGAVLISFSTKFKKEAAFKIINLAGYLNHICGEEDGLFWLDANAKAKALKSGWNEEASRPSTKPDDMHVSLEAKKRAFGKMFDLSALSAAEDPLSRPNKELIEDNTNTDAGSFSRGGASEVLNEQGCPRSAANNCQHGGVGGDNADAWSVASRASAARKQGIS